MAKQVLNLGAAADDGTGTKGRAGGDIINDNFTELYDAVTVEGWHTVGGVGEPAFGANWQNDTSGAGYADCSFYVDPFGVVRLQGLVENTAGSGLGTVIFTLPAGYRPASVLAPLAYGDGALARVGILTNGSVMLVTGSGNSALELSNISFRIA